MSSNFAAGLWTAGSWRCARALILGAMLAALIMAIASPAQAHEPYIAKAWGNNVSGELGDGTHTGPETCSKSPERSCSTTPVDVSGLSGVIVMAGGQSHSMALLEDGTVRAWGSNAFGQLGNGTTTNSDVAVAVSGLSGVTAISAGFNDSMALLGNGKVMAWGENNGLLGNGTKEHSDLPVAVCAVGTPTEKERNEKKEEPGCPTGPYLEGVKAIAAGSGSSLGVLSNGEVVAWGCRLGNGTSACSDVPVVVSGLSGVKAVAAGRFDTFNLAMLGNGKVMAWGENRYGELGDGSEATSSVPVAVCAAGAKSPCAEESKQLKEVTAIAAGSTHILALTNGKVVAWGENAFGELGTGTSTGPEECLTLPPSACAKAPVAVSGLTNVSAIAAGNHSLALLNNGGVMAWGENTQGELGTGTSTGPELCPPGSCSTKPVEVGKLVDVKGIAAGREHSLAFGPPPPTVTAVSPKEGPRAGGTSVTITGMAFGEALAVKFGSANATTFKVNSEGSITATSPPGSGTVDVSVTTPAGTSVTSSADQFRYVHVAGVEPDFGRCVEAAVVKEGKKLHYGGAFKDPGCTTQNKAKRGQYEWLPEVSGTFTSVLTNATLETTGKPKILITCSSGKAEGKYTGPTTLKVTKLAFSGCAESPSKGLASDCQNKGSKNGEIKANELVGELGFIKHAKNKKRTKVGVDLKPTSGSTLASFECGGANEITGEGSGTGTARELEGSVIGRVSTINAMTSTNTVAYEASGGTQVPEFFEGGIKDTLSMNSEPTTLAASEEVKDSEKVEINTKF